MILSTFTFYYYKTLRTFGHYGKATLALHRSMNGRQQNLIRPSDKILVQRTPLVASLGTMVIEKLLHSVDLALIYS